MCIASNAGLEGAEIIANIISNKNVFEGVSVGISSHSGVVYEENFNYGYDFLNNKYGDLMELGVIDPAKVVRLTLENAASVSGALLTTEVSIASIEEDETWKIPKQRSE